MRNLLHGVKFLHSSNRTESVEKCTCSSIYPMFGNTNLYRDYLLTYLPLVPHICMRQWTGSALVPSMACRLFGAKPLPETILTYCQLDPWEQTYMKYRLLNGGPLSKGRWNNWSCHLIFCSYCTGGSGDGIGLWGACRFTRSQQVYGRFL